MLCEYYEWNAVPLSSSVEVKLFQQCTGKDDRKDKYAENMGETGIVLQKEFRFSVTITQNEGSS